MDATFATGDLARWVEFLDEQVVYRNFNDGPYGGTYNGRDECLRALLGGITGGYEGSYRLRVIGYRELGDDLAAMDWEVTVRPSEGEPVSARGCQLLRVEAGLVTEIFEVTERRARDLVALLKQPE